MSKPRPRPYGSWPSPITAELLVEGAARISEVMADPVRPGLLWWAESRPERSGRTAVMRFDLNAEAGAAQEVTPVGANVRTLVHEYGGGAWWPHDGALYYVEYADQRLRRLERPGAEPELLTAEPSRPAGLRYADGRVTPDGRWCICVRERHDADAGEPVNELVAVAADGSQRVEPLWAEADFVMSPRISPDGALLAWIAWDHPNMAWDATRLHVCELGDGELGAEVLVTGADGDRSLCEPGWVCGDPGLSGGGAWADGERSGDRLLVCSDHENWWGLYEVDLDDGGFAPVVTGEFDVATPPWVFGMQRWAAYGSVTAAVAGRASGDELLLGGRRVATVDTSISSVTMVSPAAEVRQSRADPKTADTAPEALTSGACKATERMTVAYAGAGYKHEAEVVAVTAGRVHGEGKPRRRVVRPARDLRLDPGLLVTPEAITFPTGGGRASADGGRGGAVAHALYYRPANPACSGPPDERPPLMVMAHGGPTAAARRELQLDILFWTSRGFAVADIDYRGSTGYGRRYRQALNGAWGVADVEDCVSGARFLARRGDVDPGRLVIRGGSAGGFTVLAALAFHDVFAAGASRYGIADLEALATETHKFESRYLDTLVGPWPEARDVYAQRSPIHHLDGFNAPMIVLQGAEDEIVPPNQSEMIVEALEAKGVGVAYVLFEGEQHGFRRAENIVTALNSELAFFAAVLGFEAADDILPVEFRSRS